MHNQAALALDRASTGGQGQVSSDWIHHLLSSERGWRTSSGAPHRHQWWRRAYASHMHIWMKDRSTTSQSFSFLWSRSCDRDHHLSSCWTRRVPASSSRGQGRRSNATDHLVIHILCSFAVHSGIHLSIFLYVLHCRCNHRVLLLVSNPSEKEQGNILQSVETEQIKFTAPFDEFAKTNK